MVANRYEAAMGGMPSPTRETAPNLIVPLDGSRHSLAALPVAKALSEMLEATLHVVHIAEAALPPQELLQRLGLDPEQLRGSVLQQATGPPAMGIVHLAEEWHSRMIVMCAHAGSVWPRGVMGTVAEAVLCRAPCPVILVRPERGLLPWALRRALVPHDGTPSTAAAVGVAVDLAERSGADLHILHVADPDVRRTAEPGSMTVPQYLDQPQHEWLAWNREFIDRFRRLCGCPTSVPMRLFLGRGKASDEIVRQARERVSDLLVLVWHGHWEEERAVTLKTVIRHTPCPVLVLRAGVPPGA